MFFKRKKRFSDISIEDGCLLSEVKNNTNVILDKLDSGKKLRRKLQEMGLTEGVEFRVINNCNNGPIVVNIRGSKLALGQGMSQQIIVKELA
ncbi:MAG: FeoA family protein [Bacillota bacterium]